MDAPVVPDAPFYHVCLYGSSGISSCISSVRLSIKSACPPFGISGESTEFRIEINRRKSVHVYVRVYDLPETYRWPTRSTPEGQAPRLITEPGACLLVPSFPRFFPLLSVRSRYHERGLKTRKRKTSRREKRVLVVLVSSGPR